MHRATFLSGVFCCAVAALFASAEVVNELFGDAFHFGLNSASGSYYPIGGKFALATLIFAIPTAAIFVRMGSHVRRGDKVAAVGNTGRSTGTHLHYEVRVNGIPENPRKFILE